MNGATMDRRSKVVDELKHYLASKPADAKGLGNFLRGLGQNDLVALRDDSRVCQTARIMIPRILEDKILLNRDETSN